MPRLVEALAMVSEKRSPLLSKLPLAIPVDEVAANDSCVLKRALAVAPMPPLASAIVSKRMVPALDIAASACVAPVAVMTMPLAPAKPEKKPAFAVAVSAPAIAVERVVSVKLAPARLFNSACADVELVAVCVIADVIRDWALAINPLA